MTLALDVLKVALLAFAGWLVAAALRRGPATTRHDLWLFVIFGAVLVPATELFLPRIYFGIPPTWAPVEEAKGPWVSIILWLWAAGAIVSAARIGAGLIELRRISRHGERWVSPELARALADAARLVGITRPVTLVRSDAVQVPATWGVRHPIVALPTAATRWSAERLRLVLVHELVHVRRQDALIERLLWVAGALYWFHPAIWLAARRLRLERERACDEAVLATGARPSDYCGHLIEIMRAATTGARAAVVGVGVGAAMAAPCTLEHRVRAMLAPSTSPGPSAGAGATPGRAEERRSRFGAPVLVAGAAAIYALGALAPCAFVSADQPPRAAAAGVAR